MTIDTVTGCSARGHAEVVSADAVVEVVLEVVAILQAGPQELLWTQYRATADLMAELRRLADRVAAGDHAAVNDLKLLFAPTGTLQTVSIDSGWGFAYLDLAERFDKASVILVREWAGSS